MMMRELLVVVEEEDRAADRQEGLLRDHTLTVPMMTLSGRRRHSQAMGCRAATTTPICSGICNGRLRRPSETRIVTRIHRAAELVVVEVSAMRVPALRRI